MANVLRLHPKSDGANVFYVTMYFECQRASQAVTTEIECLLKILIQNIS